MPIFTILRVSPEVGRVYANRRVIARNVGAIKALSAVIIEVWYYVKSKSNDGIKLEVFVL